MKLSVLFLAVGSLFIHMLKARAVDNSQVVVTPEDIEIKDKTLEKKLIKAVKENGVLTNTRQVNSYMLAVLCEYPQGKTKPYCTFRKVKVSQE